MIIKMPYIRFGLVNNDKKLIYTFNDSFVHLLVTYC
jgi:hypothetical protein